MDWGRLGIVIFMLLAAMATNIVVNAEFSEHSDAFPFLGVAVWVALLLTIKLRRPDWELMPETAMGSLFLLSLVTCASLMPVEHLPTASWQTAFGLGFVSAVFDNIPLTALALKQGGYDWGMLAYAVGFGGSSACGASAMPGASAGGTTCGASSAVGTWRGRKMRNVVPLPVKLSG